MVIPRWRSNSMVSVRVVPFRNGSAGIEQAFCQSRFSCVYMSKNADIDYFHVFVLHSAPKGHKNPQQQNTFTAGDIANRHTHTYNALQAAVALLICQIYKAKVFLKRVQKTKPLARDGYNSLFPLFDYS